MRFARFHLLTLCVTAALATACGGGSASLSPISPSPAVAGASISGTVSMPSSAALATNTFHTLDAQGITISIVGSGISTMADGRGQFTLTGVPTGDVQLNITGPGSNATVTISGVGPDDHVDVTVTVNGHSAHVDSEHHSSHGNNGEISERITSIDAGTQSFVAGAWTVTTTSSTVIRHGSTTLAFADLKVGDHVQVRGTRTGTTVAATEIKVESGGDDHDGEDQGAELSGAVSGLAGTCPAITFTAGSTSVAATSTTVYSGDATCATMANGVQVEVKGTKQSDGSVLASRISIESED